MKRTQPDRHGHFGIFGGRYAAETLMPALLELEAAYRAARRDAAFQKEFAFYLREYAGRETPLYEARRLTEALGGAKIYLKREDMNHTGSHKINNTLGQALLARRMGKKKVIAETGAGQHGVATATAAALFGMECRIFMGEEDIRRQAHNVYRMKILGAEVVPVAAGTATLKDAMNEAMRAWVTSVRDTFYVIGTTAGPHPYPVMVRDFQSVIGREARRQILKKEGRLPDLLIACVGGGSNALGLFYPFLGDPGVAMIGVEAAGKGLDTGLHAASITAGRVGVLHGNKTYLLQDEHGQVRDAYAIAAGLDYPGRGAGACLAPRYGARPLRLRHGRGGGGGLRLPLPAGGDHPRPGERPCRRPCDENGARHGRGQDRDHQPLRPGRQGCGDHRREQGGKGMMGRIEERFKALKKEGRKAFVAYLTAGDPDLETTARADPGPGGRRGGHRGDRRPLLRPDGGRPRHPGRLPAGAEEGGHSGEDPGDDRPAPHGPAKSRSSCSPTTTRS